ncbi:MAG TPA: hypothetical protein VGJ01_17380 [Pseudolabrys sp.]|jgi:hypothetical protein
MSALIKRSELKWNPLEDGALDDLPPATWNGGHVGKRITEAFKTLALLPAPTRPKAFGNSWPTVSYEWADLLAQQEQEQAEKDRSAREQNRVRLSPSTADVARMEAALYWPAHYLAKAPHWLHAVNLVAIAHAYERDSDWVARRRGGEPDTWRRRYETGCAVIAGGLIHDRVPVF